MIPEILTVFVIMGILILVCLLGLIWVAEQIYNTLKRIEKELNFKNKRDERIDMKNNPTKRFPGGTGDI